jgi:UDP-N-acetylmuramoyl-L-alanyl-D-glutamate--2,6-diaminopimelate ligase
MPGGELSAVIELRAIGQVYAANACAALLAAACMGIPIRRAIEATEGQPAPPGRFEVVGEGPRAVVDYAHTPSALEGTMETARTLCEGRLTVVFGAGGERDRGKRSSMGAAAAVADRVIVTSDNPRGEDPAQIAEEILCGLEGHAGVEVDLDRERAIQRSLRGLGRDEVVVIAGRGHEVAQIGPTGSRPFSDIEVVRAAMSGG